MAEDTVREIQIEQKNIFEVEGVDLWMIPCPINGELSVGLAYDLLKILGKEVQEDINTIVPITIGAATLLDAKDLPVKGIVFAPNRETAREEPQIEHIRMSIKAALEASHTKGYYSIAIPAPLDLTKSISKREIARAIIDEVKNYRKYPPYKVILVDPSEEMAKEFSMAKVQIK